MAHKRTKSGGLNNEHNLCPGDGGGETRAILRPRRTEADVLYELWYLAEGRVASVDCLSVSVVLPSWLLAPCSATLHNLSDLPYSVPMLSILLVPCFARVSEISHLSNMFRLASLHGPCDPMIHTCRDEDRADKSRHNNSIQLFPERSS